MATNSSEPLVQVSIFETTLPALVGLKRSARDSLAEVIERLAAETLAQVDFANRASDADEPVARTVHKYEADLLGKKVGATTLSQLFGKMVDVLFEIAPDAVAKLATMRSHTRRYVAKDPARIHPRSSHLPTRKTASGYFVSRNIGKADLVRGTKALCAAAGLGFGKDVRLRL